jgi:Calcineurin-like phosphoesterase
MVSKLTNPDCARSVRSAVILALSALVATGAAGLAGAHGQDKHDRDRDHDGRDPVVFSFATVGDNRQDLKSPDPTTLLAVDPDTGEGGPSLTGTLLPQDKEYLQNSLAWTTIQSGIQSQNPNLLFFNGDMIFGYGRPTLPPDWAATGQPNSWTTSQTVSPDAFFEYVQYAYFRGAVSPLFNSGTYLIPVPGNHETQCSFSAAPYSASSPNPNCDSTATGNKTGKTAYADNENAFRANMSDLVSDLVANIRFSRVSGFNALNVSGVTPTTAPLASSNNGPITSSQAELSYSFDIQATNRLLLHFVVINTDPAGADSTAPADWLDADLKAAKARGADKFFVFGHKPAFTYNYAAASGGKIAAGGLDANPNIALRDAFWSVITKYNATYFCGHEHIPNVQKFSDPTTAYKGSPYQVIVGSGGSPFDDKLSGTCPSCTEPVLTNPYDRFYAWALVQVHKSGNVSLNLYGFSDDFGPTQELRKYSVESLQ